MSNGPAFTGEIEQEERQGLLTGRRSVALSPHTQQVTSPEAATPGVQEVETGGLMARSAAAKAVRGIGLTDPAGEDVAKSPTRIQLPSALEAAGTINDTTIGLRDITNFLVGGEMAVVGARWDQDGFSWNMENAQKQWSEAPLWSNLLDTVSLVGTAVFPLFRAAKVTTTVGKFARSGLVESLADSPVKGVASALGLKPLTYTEAAGSTFQTVRYFDKATDHASEVALLKELGYMNEAMKAEDVSDTALKKYRMLIEGKDRYTRIAEKVAKLKNGDTADMSMFEKIRYQFDRRFMNGYMKVIDDLKVSGGAQTEFHDRLSQVFNAKDMGTLFAVLPSFDEKQGQKIIASIMEKHHGARLPGFKPTVLSAEEQKMADVLEERFLTSQKERLASGFISAEEGQRVGPFYFAAQMKGTPLPSGHGTKKIPVAVEMLEDRGALQFGQAKPSLMDRLLGRTPVQEVVGQDVKKTSVLKTFEIPDLDATTLLEREHDIPEVYKLLQGGALITDPTEMTYRSYVIAEMLHENFKFMRDAALDPKYAISNADMVTKYLSKGMPVPSNMVSLQNLPKAMADRVRRMIEVAKPGALDANGTLPWVDKNVFENIVGKNGMFAQTQHAINVLDVMTMIHKTMKTVMNPASQLNNLTGNLSFMAQGGMNPLAPSSINLMSDINRAFSQLVEARRASQMSVKDFLDPTKNVLKDLDLGKVTVGKLTFDLKEEFTNPMLKQIIEEGAFENTEGMVALAEAFDRIKEGTTAKALARIALKGKDLLQVNGKVRYLDKMTKAYLAEDVVPKMAYYLHLRGNFGMTPMAAATEVGRRFPIYSTAGDAIRGARRFVFPWASFPAEAIRITKNNIMDHPIRMMPWLQMPAILQGLTSSLGAGFGFEETEEAKRGLALWAQNPMTLVTAGQRGAELASGATGAVVGGVVGGTLAGAAGAAVGGILGGAGGAALGAAGYNKSTDQIRGAVLGFLPHSSFMLASTSPDFTWSDARSVWEQVPAEPMAILKPLVDVLYGQTAWGGEIKTTGSVDAIAKSTVGLLGFLAPPWIQRYGFKTTSPDVGLADWLVGEDTPGPNITNVSRLLIESGSAIDPYTMKEGSPLFDMLLNNVGVVRSYGFSPETKMANAQLGEKLSGQVRNYYAQQLQFYALNGNEAGMSKILENVGKTFAAQYPGDPAKAQKAQQEWLKAQTKSLGLSPKLRDMSQDDLKAFIDSAGNFAQTERTQVFQLGLKAAQDELRLRRAMAKEQARKKRSSRYAKRKD